MNRRERSYRPEHEEEDRYSRTLAAAVERREFLARAGRWTGGLLLAGSLGTLASCAGRKSAETTSRAVTAPTSVPPEAAGGTGARLAVAGGGGDPGILARKAVDAIGGMSRFVRPGNVVAVKPNASFMDGPEGGTSTHPSVVSEIVAMCKQAGASRVIVTDHTLVGASETCLARNGIGAAARAAGAEIVAYGGSDGGGGVETAMDGGVSLKRALIYPIVLDADVLITLPKAKSHDGAGLSLGMKNLIGLTADMSSIHSNDLHQGIADLAGFFRPTLSVVDASISLLENGPGGPGPTRAFGTVIASPDFVAADSYACTLFGMSAADVPYVAKAGASGLGQVDFNKLEIARV